MLLNEQQLISVNALLSCPSYGMEFIDIHGIFCWQLKTQLFAEFYAKTFSVHVTLLSFLTTREAAWFIILVDTVKSVRR